MVIEEIEEKIQGTLNTMCTKPLSFYKHYIPTFPMHTPCQWHPATFLYNYFYQANVLDFNFFQFAVNTWQRVVVKVILDNYQMSHEKLISIYRLLQKLLFNLQITLNCYASNQKITYMSLKQIVSDSHNLATFKKPNCCPYLNYFVTFYNNLIFCNKVSDELVFYQCLCLQLN